MPDLTVHGVLADAAPFVSAFARVVPAAFVVSRIALPGGGAVLGAAFGVAMSLPLAPVTVPAGALSIWTLLRELLSGVPLALLLAAPLWAAMHVGWIADAVSGRRVSGTGADGHESLASSGAASLTTLTGLLVASAWLSSGGVVRAVALLAASAPGVHGGGATGVATWAIAARALADALKTGVAVASGVLVAAAVLEAGLAALGRVSAPVSVQPLAAIARPVVAILAFAVSMEGALGIVTR